ncbi:hypothetical protein AXG93_488s1170 [Marchantia polymorpha subsp. ruderalis]|uniref:F-box associated beta-propeller type 1 domain-containing protein n=1 Tax=Marchantia polymorpha subsp. ruderalis TaxID=1480154 RepID=A0A176W6R0_MARPO|nr:hypothetical protein AXG93_488s1170 [Marchantia polymorpha subsp. ruderalis]
MSTRAQASQAVELNDLIAAIFKRLPVVKLIGLRTLNQEWMTRILSSEFLARNLDQANIVLMLYVEERVVIYDVKSNSWHQRRIKDLSRSSLHVLVDPRHETSRLELIASDGGVLCFSTRDFGHFLVCNPVTKQSMCLTLENISSEITSAARDDTQLCSVHGEQRHWTDRLGRQTLGGLLVDPDTGHYKLLIATLQKGAPLRTKIYNSQSKRWTQVHDFPSGSMDFTSTRRLSIDTRSRTCNMRRGCIVWNDSLYTLVQYMDVFWDLLKFDVQKEKWSVVPLRRKVQYNLQLAVYEDKLLLVETPWWNRYSFFVIQESDGEITSWVSVLEPLSQQLETLFHLLPREFRVVCYMSFISPAGDFVYFLSHDHKCRLLGDSTCEANDLKLLVYSLQTKHLVCVDVGKNVRDLKLAESICFPFRPSLANVST